MMHLTTEHQSWLNVIILPTPSESRKAQNRVLKSIFLIKQYNDLLLCATYQQPTYHGNSRIYESYFCPGYCIYICF